MEENAFAFKSSDTHASGAPWPAAHEARAFAVSSDPSRAFDASSCARLDPYLSGFGVELLQPPAPRADHLRQAPIDECRRATAPMPVIRCVLGVTAAPNAPGKVPGGGNNWKSSAHADRRHFSSLTSVRPSGT